MIGRRNFNAMPLTQHLDNQFWGVNATLDWSTAKGTFTLLPAYRESHLDTEGSGIGTNVITREDDRQKSLEARFASNLDGPFSYIVGAYYFDEKNHVPQFVPNTQYTMSVQAYDTGVESAAAFGELAYPLTESLRATVGARYTHEEKFFRGSFSSSLRICVAPTGCPGLERIPVTQVTPLSPDGDGSDGVITNVFSIVSDETETFEKWTWRAALDWDVTDDNFLFASVQTGFKSGGFYFSNDSQVFQPEELEAFTLGSRNRLLDDRLQLDVEAFHWRYEGQQVSTIARDSPGRAQPDHPERRQRDHERRRSRVRMAGDRGHPAAAGCAVSRCHVRRLPVCRAGARRSRDAQWHRSWVDSRWTAPASGRRMRRSGPPAWPPSTRSRSATTPGSWPTPACTTSPRC